MKRRWAVAVVAGVAFAAWLTPVELRPTTRTQVIPNTYYVARTDLAAVNSELPLPALSISPFDGPRQTVVRASRGARRASYGRKVPTGAGVERWRSLVARYDWPVESVLQVIRCESGGNPNARNSRSSAAGLFQILGGSLDPEANVHQAYAMWKRRGWRDWRASIHCHHLR